MSTCSIRGEQILVRILLLLLLVVVVSSVGLAQ
jgi:hypothetical protein